MTYRHLATIIAAQMTARLPVLVDPLMYARKGLRIEGALRISDFARLGDRLANTDGEMHVNLDFDMKSGKAVVDGHVTGQLSLICQRCMNPMTLEVDSDIHLGLVVSEQEVDSLLPGYEPMMVSDEPMKVQDIVEDEILLLLPMIPSHAQKECAYVDIEDLEQTDEPGPENEAEKGNPFASLESLKKH